uniref:DNA breaking-rejoining enzyme n=1 Tax=Mycena chlorophos TaxID=658473 RepID=A0ABQ0L8P6_MYCCL|nr:DNA breaking-rejoining enzyme [Mycena chlorophos]
MPPSHPSRRPSGLCSPYLAPSRPQSTPAAASTLSFRAPPMKRIPLRLSHPALATFAPADLPRPKSTPADPSRSPSPPPVPNGTPALAMSPPLPTHPNSSALTISSKAPVPYAVPRISGLLPPQDPSSFVANVITGSVLQAFPVLPRGRRPNTDDDIVLSVFRPFVPAPMRFLAWITPYGLSNIANHIYLPAADQAKARAAILNSLKDSSLSTYAAGPKRFTQYCDRAGIPEELRMPAEPFLLACFLADSIGKHGLSSAKNWLNGVAFWHHVNFAPWSGSDVCVKKVLRAVDKDKKFVRPPRGPILAEHMRCLRSNLDLSSPRDAAFWSLATSAFYGCRRLGELTVPSVKAFDKRYHASRTAPISSSSLDGRDFLSIHLPWSKSTREAGVSLILTSTHDDLCPVWAWHNHTRVNHSPSADTPLFAYRDAASWKPIVKTSFLSFISNLFRTAKLEQVFGHSFRVGGTLFWLSLGLEPEMVMKIGGWSSNCFLIYWRKLESVLPPAISRALDKSFSAFCARNGFEDEVDAEIDFVAAT